MPLGLRLVLLILVAAVPIFVIQILHGFELYAFQRQQIVERAEAFAQNAASQQNRFAETARVLLSAVAKLPGVQARDPEGCTRELADIAELFPEITGLAVIGLDGLPICSSSGRTRPISIADRPYFKDAVSTRRTQTTGFIVGRQTGRGSFAFANPSLKDDGTVEFVVVLAISTDALSRALADPPPPEGAFVAMLDRAGIVLARWPEPEAWVGKDMSGAAWADAALKSRRGVLRTDIGGEGGEYALASAIMWAPMDATVVVGQPISPELRALDRQFWRELALTFLVFVIAAAAALAGARVAVLRPIRALTKHADSLARGDFASGANEPPAGLPELRSLAEHFQSMSQALAARQSELMEALLQKDVLLREVNHRVKNSLQLVSSLFGLQRLRIPDPGLRLHFEDAMQRVSTIARIHQRLYQDQHFDRLRFDRYLLEMCEELDKALRSQGGPHLECQASEVLLATDKAIPLALIVNELVTNAFKHAYPRGGTGVVRVDCRSDESGILLTVSDDGEKLPTGFDAAQSESLGMRMVVGLVNQLRGKLDIVPSGPGKSFVVLVPSDGGADA
ncbi:MAG: sensor histidine kinase [Propylenella sp.]